MRHFPPMCAVAALAFSVQKPATPGSLITLCGSTLRMKPCRLRTGCTAVNITPVTVAADHHLTVTLGTVEYAYGILHRLLLPMRTGLKGPRGGY